MFVQNGLGREARKSARGGSQPTDSKGLRARIRSARTGVGAFLRSGEEGQALVEMWIVLPVFLILLTGVFTFGIAYVNKMTLTTAVSEASQTLAASRSLSTDLDPCDIAWKALTAVATNLNPAQIAMTITFNSGSANSGSPITVGSLSTPGPLSCSGNWSTFQATQTETNTITAVYPCNLAIYGRGFATNCVVMAQLGSYQY